MAKPEMSRCLSRCLSQRDTIGTHWNSSESVQMSLWDKTRDVLHQSQSQSQSQSPFHVLTRARCLHHSSFNLALRNARASKDGCTCSTAGADAPCLPRPPANETRTA